ncbi:GPO family capsid scaffolding protein, partial [Collimonas sp.]|uniref:GPO family capsid scaffolding protein n=1 Tax=Collimonas sp. TaxID=1963772 RepID=UPI002BB91001
MAKTTSTAPKSKFFRVAVEGATTDGRVIDRAFIEQMAANFDPQVYGARIWVEHLRSTWADGAFKAYGDVTAVKAEEVELGGVKKLALYAQISPTPELVAMNKARQKIYTSIEINPKFSDTGEAYLVGLAVTDSPASLGTEVLSFATKNTGNLFSVAEETT